MKIIDLLNKIANGEDVPKKVRINDLSIAPIYRVLTFDEDLKLYINCDEEEFTNVLDNFHLNYEVEIIEDKKIEKLDTLVLSESYTNDKLEEYIFKAQVKINEIIDKLNKKEL